MNFYINGNKIDAQIENEKTVGEVLQSFAQELKQNKSAIYSVSVDGKLIAPENYESAYESPLSENTKFEFSVISENDVKDSLAKLSEDLISIAKEIEQVPSLFINGKGKEANESITKVADAIDSFCQISALKSFFPETFTNKMIGDMTISEFFEDFSPVLTDFENALQTNDTVLVGDLCEYEISPRLQKMADSIKAGINE